MDSPAVNAVKYGRLLILEGIEKAERGIMPVRMYSYGRVTDIQTMNN